METPSSTRMARRSQTSVVVAASASHTAKKEDPAATTLSRSRTKAAALIDITNDSPIVGLANEKTPSSCSSSSFIKNRVRVKNTPGSGEAILRGQVKTLLQKVEEEEAAELFVNKNPPFRAMLVNLPAPSPIQLLAPTPMNTPQVPGVSEFPDGVLVDIVMASLVATDHDSIKNSAAAAAAAAAAAPIQIAEVVEEECLINRALLFDSPDKSDASSVSSAVTYQGHGSVIGHKSPEEEDDSSSAWSIQVNLSVQDDDDEEVEEEEEEEDVEDYDDDDDDDDEEEEYEDGEGFDELCEGLSKMRVEEGLPEFTGKLTRFVYNSDGDIEREEVVKEKVSPNVLVLKGLPVPEGKHLRFQDDEDKDE